MSERGVVVYFRLLSCTKFKFFVSKGSIFSPASLQFTQFQLFVPHSTLLCLVFLYDEMEMDIA